MLNHPRVLVVAVSRVNARDTFNNNLLVRNLFIGWSREATAQIYSSLDNGDEGFFGRYYKLSPQDRRLGKLFYSLKRKEQERTAEATNTALQASSENTGGGARQWFQRRIVDTGLYEALFKPRLSHWLLEWVRDFRPDLIFAQGYTLTFAWLPVMLSRHLSIPMLYYPTDDWPAALYRGESRTTSPFVYLSRRMIAGASRQLVEHASVRLAFNYPMRDEYVKRYHRPFEVLMHGDRATRFRSAQPCRMAADGEWWIVTTGAFGAERFPLLRDLDEACHILQSRGKHARATVYPANNIRDFEDANPFRYVHFEKCPSHEELPAVLKGADLLFLPERFDKGAAGVRLSVSSKSHLFMFSGKPIIVYSSPETGVASYAKSDGWGLLVDRQDPTALANAIDELMTNASVRDSFVRRAAATALKNHDLDVLQPAFQKLALSIGTR